MREIKFALVLFVVVILFSGYVQLALADSVVIFIYESGASNTSACGVFNNHPSGNSSVSAVGNCFMADESGYLTGIDFKMFSLNDPNGFLKCRLGGVSGDLDANTMVPNSTVFAESTNSYQINSTEMSAAWISFLFNGTYQLTAGANYSAYVYVSEEGEFSGSAYGIVQFTFSEVAGSVSQMTQFHNSGWWSGHDFYNSYNGTYNLRVYGSTEAVTPTPTPTPSPSSTSGSGGLSDSALNVLLGNLFWWLAVLIIVLGPAFVLGVIFKGGTMGFAVGLLAGAGLGYWLMPSLVPLWVVVGVVLSAVAMIWSKMGRSN